VSVVREIPAPQRGDVDGVVTWVAEHLDGLYEGPIRASRAFRGGQGAADAALAQFDVTGYARWRSEVLPGSRRGASGLGPYIRHGLLTLPDVWSAVRGGPARDVARFRDELLWQEYARHLYARIGGLMSRRPLRYRPDTEPSGDPPWDERMVCTHEVVAELEADGWIVNQTRMWLASHWAVRHRRSLREGERWMFRRLLDGSRAANGLGWHWTSGAATGRPYSFSRYQVEKRASGLCSRCELNDACPIDSWPNPTTPTRLEPPPLLAGDPDAATTAGPSDPRIDGAPDSVWITAESLGDADPALAAHPELPVVFCFDDAVLRRMRLAAVRLVFLAESLADLAERRDVVVVRGDPIAVLAGRRIAATFTPVPGWRRRSRQLDLAAVHPWPWLVRPHAKTVASYSAWRRHIRMPE
jgi:deoxyribodipyrimidine photo-lyase